MLENAIALVVGLLAFLVSAFVLGIIVAFPTMWLWNWLMPGLFHLPVLTIWQAWGLLFLSTLLIKSGGSEAWSSPSKS